MNNEKPGRKLYVLRALWLGNDRFGRVGLLGPSVQSNPHAVILVTCEQWSEMDSSFFPFLPVARGQGVVGCP